MYSIFYHKQFSESRLGDIERKKFYAIIEDLEKRGGTDQGRIELIANKNIKYLCARLSHSDRLLFTKAQSDEKEGFVMLKVIVNHRYDQVDFHQLNNPIDHALDSLGREIEIKKDSQEAPRFVQMGDLKNAHWLGKLVTFDNDQEAILEKSQSFPLFISGHAGSGKTSVTLEMLKQIASTLQEGRILYIAKSKNLVEDSKTLYQCSHETIEEDKNLKIDFLSFHEFLEQLSINHKNLAQDIQGKSSINRYTFFSWIDIICNKKQYQPFQDAKDQLFEEFALIGGSGLQKDAYRKLGIRECIFPIDERETVYSIFEEYKQFIHRHPTHYDSNLIAHRYLDQAEKIYDFIFMDEGQDFYKTEGALPFNSLKDKNCGNFLICGDVNQVIYPTGFSISNLRQWLYKKFPKLDIIYLKNNYRNSQKVIELANRILFAKNYYLPLADKMPQEQAQSFFMKSSTQSVGGATFIHQDHIQEIKEKMLQSLPDWAVVVLDHAYKKDAHQSFGNVLIFTVQEIKGLEFKNVIIHKFISNPHLQTLVNVSKDPEETRKHIQTMRHLYQENSEITTSKSKNKMDKSLEKYKFYINALYVGVTRATDHVYVVDDQSQSAFWDLIKEDTSEVPSIESANCGNEELTSQTWKNKLIDLIKNENVEQQNVLISSLIQKQKQSFIQEVIDGLKRAGYRKEAEALKKKGAPSSSEIQTHSKAATQTLFLNPTPFDSQHSQVPRKNAQSIPHTDRHIQKERGKRKNRKTTSQIFRKKTERTQAALFSQTEVEQPSNESLIGLINDIQQLPVPVVDPLNLASGLRNTAKVKSLPQDRLDINIPDYKGLTPLHLAAQRGDMNIVRILLQKGANPAAQDVEGRTPLHIAVEYRQKNVVQLLLKNIVNQETLDKKAHEKGFTALHFAAVIGDLDIIKLLLKHKANVYAQATGGLVPLHLTIMNRHKHCVDHFLQCGVDINIQDECGYTGLHLAIEKENQGDQDMVQFLLDRKAAVDIKSIEMKQTPLHLAAEQGYTAIVAILLKHHANACEQNVNGYTPLHLAIEANHLDIVELFVKENPNIINIPSLNQETPLHFAATYGRKNIAQFLLNKGADVNAVETSLRRTPLHITAATGNIAITALLLRHKANLYARGDKGFVPLHLAIMKGCKNCADLFLKHNIDINIQNEGGYTALHLAAEKGDLEMVQFLLDHKADPNIKTTHMKATPLHVAAANGHTDIVKALIDHTKEMDAISSNGVTPLMLAINGGYFETANVLKQRAKNQPKTIQ